METEADDYGQTDTAGPAEPVAAQAPAMTEQQKADREALLKRIRREIEADKRHHKAAFERMRRDQELATWGAIRKEWGEENYTANIVGRHVKQKTAALYAKNPKLTARRRETLDFTLWDETPTTALQAFQQVQAAGSMPQMIDEFGQPVVPPQVQAAQALLDDIMSGMQRREQIKKFGKTLQLTAEYFMQEQSPLDFKSAMKQVVRRACTTGVGYVELGFQREMGPRPDVTNQLADARARLDHIAKIARDLEEDEKSDLDAERAELELTLADLQKAPEIVLREGVVFDYPDSTRVIPDRLTKKLVGFVGSRHITVEMLFTKSQVNDLFEIDLSEHQGVKVYKLKDDNTIEPADQSGTPENKENDLVCVHKFYEKTSGLCYLLCEGYDDFLREPAAPDVFVEDFWPVYALTFNDVENEKELFPPSDAALLIDAQREYNRSRQGMREHRMAARPRFFFGRGAVDEKDQDSIGRAEAFTATPLNIPPNAKLEDIFQILKIPGVDPNLYEVGQIFSDMQFIAGAQQAQLGGMSKGTATESAIAAQAAGTADGAAVDDLDAFLTRIARAMGQILLREMSEEKVVEIVGPGAVWPPVEQLEQIVNELALEVEAGSTGRPNQAQEIQNFEKMLPYLLQMPGIEPTWLARETLRRLDDRMDLTEAVAAGLPAIMAMNRSAGQPAAGPNDPNAQGDKGADNAPKPDGGPSGSDAPMGDNGNDALGGPGDTGAAPMM